MVDQPAPGKPYKEPTITVKGQRLQVVDKFTYLESTLSIVVHIDDEVNDRIAKASAASDRLRGSGTANTTVCMRNVDSLPTARQKTELLPYKRP